MSMHLSRLEFYEGWLLLYITTVWCRRKLPLQYCASLRVYPFFTNIFMVYNGGFIHCYCISMLICYNSMLLMSRHWLNVKVHEKTQDDPIEIKPTVDFGLDKAECTMVK